MADSYNVKGEVTITPPLNWAQIRELSYISRRGGKCNQSIAFDLDIVKRQTDEGELQVRTAPCLVPIDNSSGHYILENLRDLMETFPAHAFHGEFTVYPEHGLETFPYRVVARGHEAARQKLPQDAWVDDPEYP